MLRKHNTIKAIEGTIRSLSKSLLLFAENNHRNFHWRREKDAFRILIAELLLQRSRSSTVVKVYEDFIARWSDAVTLSKAEASEIEAVIRPLGLTSRAGRLKSLAIEIVKLGGVPQTSEELMSLPGIGSYTAITTAAIAFGSHELAADSVSSRVYLRYFGEGILGKSNERFQSIIHTIPSFTPKGKIHILNWAVLDLANTLCSPKSPRCEDCPLKASCSYAEAL